MKRTRLYNKCASCKYAEPLNQVFICTKEDSGYYKVGPRSLACEMFSPEDVKTEEGTTHEHG